MTAGRSAGLCQKGLLERRPTRLALIAVFLLGLLIQIAALPLRGTADVRTFKEWAVSSQSYGLLSAYDPPSPRPDDYNQPDYPPISVTLLTSVATVIDAAVGSVNADSRTVTFYIKLMTLTARLAVFGLLLWLVGRWTGDDTKALLWALAYWINPALVVNGPVLGYLDPLCVLIGLLAVVSASMSHLGTAAALAVTAALIKPQGVFFLLPVAVAAWGSRRFMQTAATAVTTGVVIVLPFVLVSGPVSFLSAMKANAVEETLSGNALNLWWLATVVIRGVKHGWEVFSIPLSWIPESQFASVTGVEPRFWMACIVIGVATWLGWLMRGVRQLPALAAYLALVIHFYFVLAVNVHENHQVYVVALLLLVTPVERQYRWFTAAVSLLVASNMVLFYGLGRDFPQVPRSGAFLVVTVVLSIANILLLAFHARLFHDLYDRMQHTVEPPAPSPGLVLSNGVLRRNVVPITR